MKNLFAQTALIALVALSAASCKKDNDAAGNGSKVTSYGSYVPVGKGKARSFVIKNENGSIHKIGFNFSETSLDGLPEHNTTFVLPMPANSKTPVNHISFDYSVHGHQPDAVYSVPHFDVHFYMITEAEKNSITVSDPKIDILPPAAAIPTHYFPGANEDKMGKHWADSTAHEFHGKDFTTTLIYGSFNGKFIFVEPMIAVSYLKTKPNVNLDIPKLGKVAQSGLFPEQYAILWEKELQEYTITISEFN